MLSCIWKCEIFSSGPLPHINDISFNFPETNNIFYNYSESKLKRTYRCVQTHFIYLKNNDALVKTRQISKGKRCNFFHCQKLVFFKSYLYLISFLAKAFFKSHFYLTTEDNRSIEMTSIYKCKWHKIMQWNRSSI